MPVCVQQLLCLIGCYQPAAGSALKYLLSIYLSPPVKEEGKKAATQFSNFWISVQYGVCAHVENITPEFLVKITDS